VPALAGTFTQLAGEFMPDASVITLVDDSLLRLTREAGSVSPTTRRRLAGHVWSAADAGADVVMVTCSSMGSAVELVQPLCEVPLLRVDSPMVEEALVLGSRIGVLATLPTTLGPTADLLHRKASERSNGVHIVERLATGAFDAAMRGDTEAHDKFVMAEFEQLVDEVDVVVLAQASMARVLETFGQTTKIPVLASPRSAMRRVAEVARQLRG
jgi:Asp/Glu/hydantoin racemase